MTWSLDYAREPGRVATLTRLYANDTARWDGRQPSTSRGATEPRLVRAGAQFTGPPGRELEAAEAWEFEVRVYFKRGVEEQPQVSYDGGVYTVTGLIQTTHPGDHPKPDGIVWFT